MCTADRPPRLHHVGAPQTIEQANLFGGAVRWFFEPGVQNGADSGWWRSLGARAAIEATSGAGPVHLNLAFDEPLLGIAGPLPPVRADGGPWHGIVAFHSVPADPKHGTQRWGDSGVIVVGSGAPSAELMLEVADRLGYPVLADPRSGIRVEHPAVVGAADAILRDPDVRDALAPDTVLVFGGPWASRVLAEFVETAGRSGAEVVAVDPVSWVDPARVVHEVHPIDKEIYLASLGSLPARGSTRWRSKWERAEAAAQAAIDKALDNDWLTAGGRTTEPLSLIHI